MECCVKYTDYLDQTLNSVTESQASVEDQSYINIVKMLFKVISMLLP